MADTTQGGFTTGSDTRKVIKNATKDPTMSGNTTKTIMSSDELRSKDRKLDVHLGKTKTTTPKNNNVTVPQTTTAPTNTPVSTGANVPMTQQTGGNNIGLNGISVPVAGQNTAPQMSQDAFVNTNGRAADLATLNVLDVDGMLEDLFIDVGEGLQNGKLSTTPVSKIKERYNELGLMDDKVVTDLVSDIAKMHQKGLSMDLNATEKLKSLYPELAGVERGFYSSNPNMYQAGGMKEVMNANTPFNLNKYGTMGTVAETVVNPLGQGFTALDAATQTIGQVDDNTDKLLGFIDIKSTPELKKALASLTDEDIQKYYQRYLNAVEENPTLSQAWTRRVPGDTVVEQLWNMVSGNTFIDKDAGFRDWLIDQVNLETNGWQGEFWGAANELKGMSGPNIAKMYANLPASTLKTVTAIGNAVTNPVDTAGGLYTLGADLVKNINEKGWGKGFSDSIIGQRYGSWEALGNAMEQDPVGVSSDILMLGQGGASAAGKVGALTKRGATGARIATHMMGAEKISKGLTRVINRLDKMAKASKEVSKISGTASNLGVDQFLHGWTTPKGKKIPGLINGLEEWAKSSNSLAAKGAKYLAEHTTAKPAVETAKALLHPTKTLAGKLTGTSTPESKLFQAASPNINKLTKGVDYKNKKANMDTATQAIVDAGYTPKTVAEWAQAHVDTLNKLWDEFTAKVKGKADVEVDASRVVQKAEAYIAEIGEDLAENQRSDLKALKNEVSRIKKRGKINMKSLENLKEMFNAETRNKTNTAKGEIYTRGLKKLSEAIGDIQNEILSKSPDEVKALKKKIGALLDTKEDVIKANVKQQKRKESGGLVENYGRLSGIGDIIGGTLSIPVKGGEGVAQAAKGLGKLILGKALGKAKDVDFLTEQGFKGLQKKSGKTADSTKSLKKKEITKGSDLDALYNLKIAKDELKKKLDKGQISKDEYKRRVDDIDYDISQLKARGAKGDVEYELKSEEGKALEKKYGEEMMEKKLGFRKETEEAIKAEMKRAEENGETVRGWTKVKQKLYALSKNPTSTTAQHEFFHAVFDVVDPTTRRYLLDEAKKIMKENGMSDANAEEWLAESFAIYAKRKDIKLGVLERRKGIQGIKDRIGDFFQRVYEWIQNYNGDRRAINKIFNTILDNKWNLDSNGGLDLSYLLGNKALSKKRELGNAKGGVKFKKDTGAVKYKTDVNGKSVDIDTKATSPDQLIEKNADGLSVMKSFISEKQAKKALNVNKALLDKDGNPYLWTSTNKNNAQLISDFRNVEDSKYKEFTDAGKEIAWFTNYDVMSKSYAQGKSVLADTKPYKSIADFNKQNSTVDKFKTEGTTKKGTKYSEEKVQTLGAVIKKNGDKYDLVSTARFEHKMPFTLDQLLDEADIAKEGYNWVAGITDENKMHPLTKEERIERLKYQFGGYSNHTYKVELETMPNGNVNVIQSTDRLLKSFDSEKAALAEGKAHLSIKDKYHYQGIMQDMKNPLVVDVKGEGNAPSFWNNIGNAYDLLKKEDAEGLKKLEKAQKKYDETIGKYAQDRLDLDVRAQRLRQEYSDRFIKYETDKPLRDMAPDEREKAIKEIERLNTDKEWAFNAKYQLVDMLWGKIDDLHSGVDTWVAEHKDFYKLYEDIKKFTAENKDMAEFMKNLNQEGALEWLGKNGVDDATLSLFHKALWGLNKDRLQDFSFITALKRKELQTNDYVFWALRKGNYDGVLFKNIIDYGDTPVGGWENAKGGDVVAAFNSKQFKAWDNANPTDSKYISYKKDVGLSKKNDNSEGIKYKRGYHGTSALFNKFDSSHMGEGEGAQAHGWGHYIAVNKKTGEYYAQGKNEYTYNWDRAKSKGWKEEIMVNRIIDDINNYGGTPKEAIEATRKGYEAQMKGAPEALQKSIQADLDTLNKIDADNFNYNGDAHLYEIDVPDPIKKDTPTGKNYWEEGGTITNKQFSKIADKLKEKYPYQFNNPNGWNDDYLFGQFLNYRQGGFSEKMNGRQIYNMISEIVGSDKEASKFLESLGYDGIHYYGGRDGEAYVIFGDDTPQITKRLYKKDVGLNAKNGYRIDEDAKTPEQLVKDVNGASEMVSFISEKQAKMAHDVSKDLLSKDGNPYMWMHTNKYNDKMFSDFKATRDSKYSLYTSKDIAWFSNSNNITQSYAEGKSKLAPTKRFNSIEEFNKYADKNVLDDGWKIQRYGDEKEITKSQIAEWNGKYVPHTISTYENKFDTLADAYAHFNDDGLMKNRGISTKIGELPADPKEAIAKLEKYIKTKEGGDIKIKGDAEKLSSKIDIETKFDNYNTLGYFDNKNDALAEAYQKATPSDYYTYKGIITNMKKPYVVDYSDYKFGKYWNKLGTLTDFAKREGGEKIAKAIDYVNHYDNLKYDLIDFLENGKKDLLGDDGKYIEGNMIEDKDYFLTNIIRNIREGTVDTLLSDGAWKGDEFASIKDDIVHGTKTYGDLYDMLQHLKGNTGLGFMEDYGTLPEVLDKLGVSEGVKNTLIQKLIDREYFDGAPLSYGDRIEIKGIRDLIKKLGGINLETNDYVKYAINNGDYDGVVFKNIIDYGGTPKEGWDKAEPGDVAVTFNSKQFKSWDNADPTESRYISYKKDTKGLTRKDMGLKAKDQTQTPEFKKWFKGSKVVNEDGTPKVVYHGSKQGNFNIFDRAKIGKQTDSGMLGRGFYFSSDIDYSKTYGDTRAFYLDIKNPFEIKTEADQDRFFDLYLKDISLKHMQETKGTLKGYGDWSDEMKERNTQALRDKGYDGVIWYDRGKKEYVVFEPNQIKSATDNVGTFDKNNPDIRYKRAYHGSKADFDRFDSSHMGEGEGQQIHGWGHYVAIDKDVAKKYYAEMGALKYKDKQIGGYDNLISEIEDLPVDKKNMIQHIAYEVQKKGKTASEAKNDLINSYTKDIENLKGFIDKNEKKLEQLKKAGKTSRVDYQGMINNAKRYIDRDNLLLTITKNLDENDFSKRNLYELEIPDPIKKDTPTGSNYLEEEGKITRPQLDKIVKALESYIPEKEIEKGADLPFSKDVTQGLATARQRYAMRQLKEWGLSGEETYKALSTVLGGDKQASKFLESLGYDGIHYFGGRDGEAYVLFNDDAPQIQNHIRYKKAYHGGGKFDKFDLSHVGEGEGNKAHGYGLYFTENEARAREYGDLYRNNKYGLGIWGGNGQFVTYKGKTLNQIDGEYSSIIRRIIEGMQNRNDANPYYTAEAQIAAVRNGLREQQMVWDGRGLTSKGSKEKFNKEMDFLDSLNPKDFKVQKEKRNLYEVDVPEIRKADTPTKTNYIEEGDIVDNDAYKIINDKLFKETGNKMQRWSSKVDGKTMYSRLSEVLGGDKQASEFLRDMGYDGIHYIGKEDGSSYVLFNDNTPQIQNHIRYKKDTSGLAKKDNGLRKKADIQQKTSSLGRHKSEIDSFARQLGVTGDTPLQKMKQMNKIIKDPKYQGTKIKKDLYALKWNIKKEYILDNNKKIKDRGPNNTKLVVWQNGEKATWHFIPSQYYELKRMGVLE